MENHGAKMLRPLGLTYKYWQRGTEAPPERTRASGLVAGKCCMADTTAIRMGTPMNAPGMPQRNAQKNTENRTRNGEIDSRAPAIRGSRKLPMTN